MGIILGLAFKTRASALKNEPVRMPRFKVTSAAALVAAANPGAIVLICNSPPLRSPAASPS